MPPKFSAALRAPRVLQGDLDPRLVLADAPERALASGAGPLSIVATGILAEGERIGGFVDVPSDACVLAYARGATSVDDVDVAAFTDEGSPIVVDEAPDAHPTILLCPPHPDRVFVSARVTGGGGLVAVGTHLVSVARAQDVGRVLSVRGGSGDPQRMAVWPGLDDIVREHRETLGGKWEEFRRVAIMVDPRAPSFASFVIEANQCVDSVVVADDEVGVMDVELFDSQSRSLARSREAGRLRTLTVCSPHRMEASIGVRPHSGRGLAVVTLSRAREDGARAMATRADVVWVPSSLALSESKDKCEVRLASAGYGAARAKTEGQLLIGRRTSLSFESPRADDGCDRVEVVAGAPLSYIGAVGWDGRDGLAGEGQGVDGATVFVCTKGAYRIDLDARGRPGPFAASVRTERWRSPVFLNHGLASSRMLSSATDGPERLHRGRVLDTRVAPLDAAKRSVWERTLDSGECLLVAAGGEGEGMGVSLRAFEAISGVELDRAQGAHQSRVHVCATEEVRHVRIELRVEAGKMDVVIGERLISP